MRKRRLALCALVTFFVLLAACQKNRLAARRPNSSDTAVFYASQVFINRGESTSLIWSCPTASSVSISGVGQVGTSGSFPVSPTITTTYILDARFPSGAATRVVTITVNEQPKS